jgi:hypothetical protein
MKTLKVLPIEEIKILKVIRVIGPDWNNFTGHLPYTRTLSKTYDYKAGDLLDQNLLESIKKTYPNSLLVENRIILIEGELEERLRYIRGGSEKTFTINFFPYVDLPYERMHELLGKTMTSYLVDLKLRLDISEQNPKYQHIYDAELCYIDYRQIDDLVKTIQTV